MILLSVGTQFPFDRLVIAVDKWAAEAGRTDIVAQIGLSAYKPAMMKSFTLVSPDEMRTLQAEAEVIISHAGMGSILTAMELGKSIIVMPRDHNLGEHRNGHQIATADRFKDTEGVFVVYDEASLFQKLDNLGGLIAARNGPRSDLENLARGLRSFINGDQRIK